VQRRAHHGGLRGCLGAAPPDPCRFDRREVTVMLMWPGRERMLTAVPVALKTDAIAQRLVDRRFGRAQTASCLPAPARFAVRVCARPRSPMSIADGLAPAAADCCKIRYP